jgi:hypothetical protein
MKVAFGGILPNSVAYVVSIASSYRCRPLMPLTLIIQSVVFATRHDEALQEGTIHDEASGGCTEYSPQSLPLGFTEWPVPLLRTLPSLPRELKNPKHLPKSWRFGLCRHESSTTPYRVPLLPVSVQVSVQVRVRRYRVYRVYRRQTSNLNHNHSSLPFQPTRNVNILWSKESQIRSFPLASICNRYDSWMVHVNGQATDRFLVPSRQPMRWASIAFHGSSPVCQASIVRLITTYYS